MESVSRRSAIEGSSGTEGVKRNETRHERHRCGGRKRRSSSAESCLFSQEPTTQGDNGPDGLEDAERPSASQKPICAAKGARSGEAKSEPVTPRLEGVT